MARERDAVPCKVCATPAPYFDSCDFNAHCERRASPHLLPESGVAVPYYRCPACGFLFTPFMDGFSRQEYVERVYNDDYRLVDPEFEEKRPAELATWLLGHFGHLPLSICDYGGGRGRMAQLLNAAGSGMRATTWDPFFNDAPMPATKFGMVVSWEVFEHTPAPARTLWEMLSLTDQNRLILMSTLCQPDDIGGCRAGWWYCSPRNGHVSLHTTTSLDRLADDAGVGVTHLGPGTHLFHDVIPPWLLGFVANHHRA